MASSCRFARIGRSRDSSQTVRIRRQSAHTPVFRVRTGCHLIAKTFWILSAWTSNTELSQSDRSDPHHSIRSNIRSAMRRRPSCSRPAGPMSCRSDGTRSVVASVRRRHELPGGAVDLRSRRQEPHRSGSACGPLGHGRIPQRCTVAAGRAVASWALSVWGGAQSRSAPAHVACQDGEGRGLEDQLHQGVRGTSAVAGARPMVRPSTAA
jgi:hypothetical protein